MMLPLGADQATVEDAGRPVVWEISEEYPIGRARPMTDDELEQHQLDVAAAEEQASKPPTPTLEEKFHQVVDAVLNAPDFDTAKKQIAALKEATDAT